MAISTNPSAPLPTSSGLEQDARREHHTGHDQASLGEIAIGVVIGRTSEFFDFFVYAIAAVLVFPSFLFPNTDPLTGTLYSFVIFALAFVARPLGSLFFMEVDRRHGRGTKLTIALFLLGGSTAAIAFLPSPLSIGGYAVALLCLARAAQGFALGGAWDGLSSLLALNAPQKRRGFWAMIPQLGAPFGFLLAASLFAYLTSSMSQQDFQEWGWRYPFFVAFAINVVALFARLRLVATHEFSSMLQKQELQPVPVQEVVERNGSNILVGAFVPLACYALFHLVTVFPLAWTALRPGTDISGFLQVQMAGAGVMFVMVVLSGWIADITGRRTLLGVGAALIGLFSFVAPFTLRGPDATGYGFVLVGFALLGLSFGQASGAVASGLPRRYRYTGSAMISDLGWLIGAGFAPLVVLGLSNLIGVVSVGGYLLSGVVCTLLALRLNRQLEMRDH
ncbi:MFS transporter [Pseudoroseomonas globiformis]|uniref:MFS transporter n=1 Tax=Teichococcus globiformis TaxID=2307229 RepID=A0ABV7FVR7_9PROT